MYGSCPIHSLCVRIPPGFRSVIHVWKAIGFLTETLNCYTECRRRRWWWRRWRRPFQFSTTTPTWWARRGDIPIIICRSEQEFRSLNCCFAECKSLASQDLKVPSLICWARLFAIKCRPKSGTALSPVNATSSRVKMDIWIVTLFWSTEWIRLVNAMYRKMRMMSKLQEEGGKRGREECEAMQHREQLRFPVC